MKHTDLAGIKSIWFDFGQVLLPLNVEKTYLKFQELGGTSELKNNDTLFHAWERGELKAHEFYQKLKSNLSGFASTPSVIDAWNAMLLDLPTEHFELLQYLKPKYEMFLVSNTNAIHIKSIRQNMGLFQYNQFSKLFNGLFYSYAMGARKPEAAYFKMVLKASKYKASQCLFIDDNEENIEAAKRHGLQTWLFNPEVDSLKVLKPKMAR